MRRIPQNRIQPKSIQPKISTMPRQRSESAAFLDIYKLVIEKKRLQQELENMEQRRQQIANRLAALDAQVADLEKIAQQLRSQTDPPAAAPNPCSKQPSPSHCQDDGDFETFFLEY